MSENLSPKTNGPPKVTSKLAPVSLEKIKKWKLSPGNIYFIPKKGRPVLLFNAGEALQWDRLIKFKGKNETKLAMEIIVNLPLIEEGVSILSSMIERENFLVKISKRNEFIDWVKKNFLSKGESNSLLQNELNFIFCGTQSFLKLDENYTKKFQDAAIILFHRSLKVSSLAVVLALGLGYIEKNYLSDIYHVSMFLDIGLWNKDLSSFTMTACEHERSTSNGGVAYLESLRLKSQEVNLENFETHPTVGKQIVEKDFKNIFFYPESIKLIERHHEYEDGKGFPKGLHKTQLSEFEEICMLADHLVPFEVLNIEKDKVVSSQTFVEEAFLKLREIEANSDQRFYYITKRVLAGFSLVKEKAA